MTSESITQPQPESGASGPGPGPRMKLTCITADKHPISLRNQDDGSVGHRVDTETAPGMSPWRMLIPVLN